MGIYLFNKPYDVLCQFTDAEGRQTLADFIETKGIYPAGRLDRDSEGLLLLTDEGQLQHLISHPKHKMEKTYWVQVEGEIDAEACQQLINGVNLKDGSAHALVAEPMAAPDIWERQPPVRFRKSVPTSWLRLVINEGRNRQVRRMTAAINFPTLRLIRIAIGPWSIEGMSLGELKQGVVPDELQEQLKATISVQRKRATRRSSSKIPRQSAPFRHKRK